MFTKNPISKWRKYNPNYILKGTLLSFTQITIPPQIFSEQAPYIIGIIQLENGNKITAQITDINMKDLKIGMKIKSCFRTIYSANAKETINYGVKFTPIENL